MSAAGAAGTPSEGGGEPDPVVRLFTRLRDAVNPRVKNLVPYTRTHDALRSAYGRRVAIEETAGELHREFIEVPPTASRYDLVDRDPDPAQMPQLRRQLQADELLLLGRAGDAVVTAFRAATGDDDKSFAELAAATQPTVAIERIPPVLRRLRHDLFPWRVVIRTTDRHFFMKEIRDSAAWFGIGIDLVADEPIEAHGHCRAGGADGTVAGALRSNGWVGQLTCAHVLGQDCHCATWVNRDVPSASRPVTYGPDAAVIAGESACFPLDLDVVDEVRPATYPDLLRLQAEWKDIVRIGPRGYRLGKVERFPIRGRLNAAESDTWHHPQGGGLCRFPVIQVSPKRTLRGLFKWPLVPRRFSRPGDSGSWVVAADEPVWLGMVTAGRGQLSLVLDAEMLVAHLTREGVLPDSEGVECLTSR